MGRFAENLLCSMQALCWVLGTQFGLCALIKTETLPCPQRSVWWQRQAWDQAVKE